MNEKMSGQEMDERNLKPHSEAVLARLVWGYAYSMQRCGQMDFWDSLPIADKQRVKQWVDEIILAPAGRAALPKEQSP